MPTNFYATPIAPHLPPTRRPPVPPTVPDDTDYDKLPPPRMPDLPSFPPGKRRSPPPPKPEKPPTVH